MNLIYICLLLTVSIAFRPRHDKTFKNDANNRYISISDLGPRSRYDTINKHFRNTASIQIPHANKDYIPEIPTVYITDFGGDPYGVNDSTLAFEQAINISLTKYGSPNTLMANQIKDCGGVTIDLAGGDYLVSKSLNIPPMYGNLRIIDGTIRASNTFTSNNGYLLNVGDVNFNCTNGDVCNENIGIENLMLDCRQKCSGALFVYRTMGTVIGPQIFIIGYTNAGITVFKGHEAMITNAWLGQYYWSDPRRGSSNATSIQLFQADSYILDVIVFGGELALQLNGWDNVIEGLHTWNDGPGIVINGHNNRLSQCYLDGNSIFLYSPIQTIIIENTLFLGGRVQLIANQTQSEIKSLYFRNSIYSNAGLYNSPTILLIEKNGNKFFNVENMIVDGIMLNRDNGINYIMKSTVAESVLTLKNSTKWLFDFTDILLFGDNIGINMIDYSIKIDNNSQNKFVQHIVTNQNNNSRIVIVETDKPCDATVYIKVDQSKYNPYA